MEFQAENEQDGNKPVTSKITAYDTQTFQTYHGRIYFDEYIFLSRSYKVYVSSVIFLVDVSSIKLINTCISNQYLNEKNSSYL